MKLGIIYKRIEYSFGRILKLFIIVILLFFQMSCSNEKSSCINMEVINNDFQSEPLIKDFVHISFPSNYEGGIIQTFCGNYFYKSSVDNQSQFHYIFDDGFYLWPYGSTLNDSLPVYATNSRYENQLLDREFNFCLGEQNICKLFYNSKDTITSQLYIKVGEEYKRSLTGNFPSENFEKVLEIHKSIRLN